MKKIFLFILLIFSLIKNDEVFSQTPVMDSLLKILQTEKEDTNKVNTLNALSKQLWQKGDYSPAKKYAEEALALANSIPFEKEHGWTKGEANAYNNLGAIYSYEGNFSEALKNYFASLKIREEIGDKRGIATSYNNIGGIYSKQGKYPEALKNHLASLKIKEEIGDKQGMATSYNNIGNVYADQGNYSEALKSNLASLKISEEIGNKRGIALACNNLGYVYAAQGNYPEALKNALASLKIREEIGDKHGIAESYNNIGDYYDNQGNYSEALNNHFASLKIREEIGDQEGIARSYNNIGIVYFKQKKFAAAVQYLNKSLVIAVENGSRYDYDQTYSDLAQASAGMNDYKKAYEYHRLYSALKDTLLNEESSKQIAQMNEQYESDKKDQQIIVLNKDKELQTQKANQQRIIRNVIIGGAIGVIALLTLVFYQLYRRRQAKLSLQIYQLNNKVLRTQLNPHFIFNALNSIRNFIQQHAEAADIYLTKFSTLMRQVLENSEEEKITLQEEIAMLENYMQLEALRLPYGFDYEISIGEDVDAANTMIPPLILQPMVENSIWHGLKPLNRKGKITLRFSVSNRLLEATIEDNGIGLDSTTIETKSAEKKRSLGMQITHERIELLNRKAKAKGWLAQRLLEKGSEVEIAIPIY